MKFKIGDIVLCLGEGIDVFKIDTIDKTSAGLINKKGYYHGHESLNKLTKIPKTKYNLIKNGIFYG